MRRVAFQGRESSQATTNRPIMGRQIYFAPIDLVEDRARTRVVGVAVITAVYKTRPKTGSRRMLVLLVLPRGIGLHCKAGRGAVRSVAWHRAKGPSDPTPTFCWHQNGGPAPIPFSCACDIFRAPQALFCIYLFFGGMRCHE